MLEKKVVQDIKKFLIANYPGVWEKIHGSGYQRAGISDLIGCHRGRFIAIEVKTPKTKNNVSELQKKFIRDVQEAGGIAFVAWDVDMVKEVMEKEFKGENKTCLKKGIKSSTKKIIRSTK